MTASTIRSGVPSDTTGRAKRSSTRRVNGNLRPRQQTVLLMRTKILTPAFSDLLLEEGSREWKRVVPAARNQPP